MGNYATATELRQFQHAGQCVDLQLFSDAQLDAEIDLAEEQVEQFTGATFYTQSLTLLFDGNGLETLLFYDVVELPNISVSSVTEIEPDGTLIDTLVENDDYVRYEDRLEIVDCIDRTMRHRVRAYARWPRGQKNIKVVGVWGYSAVPKAVKRATLLLAAQKIQPSVVGLTKTGLRRVEFPDYQVEFGRGLADSTLGETTGYQETDELLIPHIKNVIYMRVVPDKRGDFDA